MKYTMARYTVKPEKLKEVKQAIAEFVAEVRAHEPRTFYAVFRENSKPTFVHLMCFESDSARRDHAQSHYNAHFVKKVYPHCVGKPVFTEQDMFATSRKQWVLVNG